MRHAYNPVSCPAVHFRHEWAGTDVLSVQHAT